jgi:hypothetical protein
MRIASSAVSASNLMAWIRVRLMPVTRQVLPTKQEHMIYWEGLPVNSRRKPRSTSGSEVVAVETIFGPSPLLPGEDASAYEDLHRRVSAEVKPADIIEKIWVRDVVDHTWEVFRLRRIKMRLVSIGGRESLSNRLAPLLRELPEYAEAEKAGTLNGQTVREVSRELARQWAHDDPVIVAWSTSKSQMSAFQ